jgi:hypothetical protein
MKKLFLIFIIILLACPVFADEELPIDGYLLLNYSARTTDNDDYIVAEERLQLELAKDIYDPVNASFFLKIDFIKDELADEDLGDDSTRTDTREAYVTLTFDTFDLKIGRQITTWGTGDLLFINDIFPKDWTSLISGRPLQYLKIGTSSLKLGYYSSLVNTDLIITPYFEADVLPDGRRLYAYMPSMPPGITQTTTVLPEKSVSNSEISLKLSKYIGDNDIALYLHRTYWRTPHMRFIGATAETYYPDLLVYGASLQRSLFGGVAKLEAGYYQSREDERGTDPLVRNSERRYLIGFEKEIMTELTLGLQYYSEIMHDYSEYKANRPVSEPKRDEVRRVVSIRLTRFMMYQTLKLSLYTQYSPSDDDYYVNPEIKYNIADNLYAAIGTNVFGGTDGHTMYGQFDGNDNVYAQLRYDF